MILTPHQCLTLTGPQGNTGTPGGAETQAVGRSGSLLERYGWHSRPELKDSKGEGEGSTEGVHLGAHTVLRGPAQS